MNVFNFRNVLRAQLHHDELPCISCDVVVDVETSCLVLPGGDSREQRDQALFFLVGQVNEERREREIIQQTHE